ncbi:MAG: hypothetical protein ABI266_07600 [Ginsengibacter sp.]
MLEELFNLVKGVANDNPDHSNMVPAEHKDAVVAEATNTVASGLRNMVAGGGVESLLSLFGGNNSSNIAQSGKGLLSNPIVSMMVGHFASKLMSKFNMGSGDASNVASSMIPNVISNLVNKTNDPSDNGFSLGGLLNSITGGKANELAPQEPGGGGLSGMLGQLMGGGNQNSGGGGGLMDIVKQLAGGAQQQQQKNGGGGLMDLIKGFIK